MDRQIVKSGQIPLSTDLLNSERSTMIALGWLAQGVLGTGTLVDGLACTPTSPASMAVSVAPGQIFEIESVDASSYSSLSSDTVHQILKQGLLLDAVSFTLTAPSTSGQAQNYLIQVGYSDVDDTPVVRPYYNSANPDVGLSGPAGSGAADNTFRRGKCVVGVKAGAAATSGSQTTPSPDPGSVGLFAITVANGATSVTSGNIVQLPGAPFINPKLPAIPADVQNNAWVYAVDTSGTANAIVVSPTPAIAALTAGLKLRIKVANANTGAVTINPSGLGNTSATHVDGSAIKPGEVIAGAVIDAIFDGAAFQVTAGLKTLPSWFRMDTPNVTYAAGVQTTAHNFQNANSNLTDSVINQAAATFTVGPKDAGVWSIFGSLGTDGASSSELALIQKNGVNKSVSSNMSSSGEISLLDNFIGYVDKLVAGDVITISLTQASSGGRPSTSGVYHFSGVRIS